jgi:hypothetical protein
VRWSGLPDTQKPTCKSPPASQIPPSLAHTGALDKHPPITGGWSWKTLVEKISDPWHPKELDEDTQIAKQQQSFIESRENE